MPTALGLAAVGLGLVGSFSSIGAAKAQIVEYSYDLRINGSAPGSSLESAAGSWINVQLQDRAKGVHIAINPLGLTAGEFVTAIGFRLAEGVADSSDSAVCADVTSYQQLVCPVRLVKGEFSIPSSGNGGDLGPFDFGVEFATAANGGNRLGAGTRAEFFVDGLNANSFLKAQGFKVDGLDELVYSVAKVQGINGNPSSGVIGSGPPLDPVPGPVPILGAMAAFQSGRRLRRRLRLARAVEPCQLQSATGVGQVAQRHGMISRLRSQRRCPSTWLMIRRVPS